MKNVVSPYDVMRYERFLSEKLAELCDFEDEYREFERSRQENDGISGYKPLLARAEAHPLFNMLFAAREEIDRFFLEDDMKISNRVTELIHVGRSFDVLEGVELIDVNKENTGEDFVDYYIEKLWKESDPWDMFFELEVAGLMFERGLDISLVKEGHKGGPDVLLRQEDSRGVWIECKRKRMPEKERNYRRTTQRLFDKLHESVDVGDGIFAVRISGDGISNSNLDPIVSKTVEIFENNRQASEVETEGYRFEIEVLKSTDGPTEMDFPLVEDRRGPAKMSDLNAFAEGLGLDVESSDDFHVDGPVEVTPAGNTVVSECLALALDIPMSIDYESWIMNTVKRARKEMTDYWPAVIFIDLPAQKLAEMHWNVTTDHRGEEVSYYERIGQRMGGVFNVSQSINGIIITSKLSDSSGLARGMTSYWNESPRYELSTELQDELEHLVSRDS